MHSLNLYLLTRYKGNDIDVVERTMSGRNEPLKIKRYEFDTVCSFVEAVLNKDSTIDLLDGFFYSFIIDHIGKEFDLLKFGDGKTVLNIELKSQMVEQEDMKQQLIKNRYYLSPVANKVVSYTYVMDKNLLFCLGEDDILRPCEIEDVIGTMKKMRCVPDFEIEKLFRAKDYLVSPLNSTEAFLNGKYFLTQQQQKIKNEIMIKLLEEPGESIVGVTGEAGTGKTLLLFDVIKSVAGHGKCCLIHCGILCRGHETLNDKMNNVSVFPVKDVTEKTISEYDFIFLDEIHRIHLNNLYLILESVNKAHKQLVCAYDYKQVLSFSERNHNIPQRLNGIPGYKEYKLSKKIRTNKELMRFILKMLDLRKQVDGYTEYKNIDVVYANDVSEANCILDLYRQKEYVVIGYTKSKYQSSTIDQYVEDYDTHHVIGQEFENVMVVMDENFAYDENGKLVAKEHPNPDYSFAQLLFQGVSRVREKLGILVCGNPELYEKLIQIKKETR